jgi:predicted nucleic acid-binding protein
MLLTALPFRDRRFFVDSSAYLGILDQDDEHHVAALSTLAELADRRFRPFTTNIVVIEAHALIMSTLGVDQGVSFLRSVEQGSTTVVRSRSADEQRAKEIIFRYLDKDFSFTDAISFAVMERLGIRYAFTFDRHFAQYGFTSL